MQESSAKTQTKEKGKTNEIDADALMIQLENRQASLVRGWGYRDQYTRGFDEAVEQVQKASTLDAMEVVHGQWVFGTANH